MHSGVPSAIRWPEGFSEARFLDEIWQQKPLLIRQAFADFDTPITADELAGLSLEPDTTPRLITRDDDGDYHLEHGPFESSRYTSLTSSDWSLLVTDVEKHLPELQAYLTAFQFLPSWRIDDLMISYAPVGASVGAHIDEYDVFLLQASGRRRWMIDRNSHSQQSTTSHGDLKLVEHFKATDDWELMPGDMLYLPPGVAHHGIASEDSCTTWSIGFRAPLLSDMVMRISEMIADAMPSNRYRDTVLTHAVPGEITAAAIENFRSEWLKATAMDTPAFSSLVGKLLTESGVSDSADTQMNPTIITDNCEQSVYKASFSQLAWHQRSSNAFDAVQLFVDGEVHRCSKMLAIQLCGSHPANPVSTHRLEPDDQVLVARLVANGSLVLLT